MFFYSDDFMEELLGRPLNEREIYNHAYMQCTSSDLMNQAIAGLGNGDPVWEFNRRVQDHQQARKEHIAFERMLSQLDEDKRRDMSMEQIEDQKSIIVENMKAGS